jgi:alpha-tubulin suppressor-like RCC1 family protein
MKKIISTTIYGLLICLLLGSSLVNVQGNHSMLIQESDPLTGTVDDQPLVRALSISSGGEHTCALTSEGGVKCWGLNFYGQLGSGTNIDSRTPVDVSGLSGNIVTVRAGDQHTCAITSEGGVKCWGKNQFGQLGNGTKNDSLTPVDVVGFPDEGEDAIAISVGANHTCLVTSTGGVKCWGWNINGQLGNGTTTDSSTPVDVSGLETGVVEVSTGENHTCALTSVGGVKCWGGNASGRLGNGTTSVRITYPVDVVGLTSGALKVSAGNNHTCAINSLGGVKCWGSNVYHQLGDGTTWSSTTPVNVSGLTSGVITLSAGKYHTCVLTSAGLVKCWGDNRYGQLSDGVESGQLIPVEVDDIDIKVVAVSAGGNHTCVLTLAGGIKCWGDNSFGQLGDGTTTRIFTAADVIDLENEVISVSSGSDHTCAITSAGKGKCWGDNSYGKLGDGTTISRSTPVDVSELFSEVIAVSTGYMHSCALTSEGGVKCWGNNDYLQLGDGTNSSRITPVDVDELTSGTKMVSLGIFHTCAITATDGVNCWGNNEDAQLGDGTNTSQSTPVNVVGLANEVVAVSAGYQHTCALTSAGGVKCWGENGYGQLGTGNTIDSKTPVDVSGLTDGVKAISAAFEHTCALMSTGGVKCWGNNMYGQLGDGTQISRNSPVNVVGLTSGIQAISVGGGHTCALTSTGGVKCWGINFNGQLGDGTTDSSNTPVTVSGLTSGVKEVSAGTFHTCAITSEGGVKCWGDNVYGQLGSSTLWIPVDVIGFVENFKVYVPVIFR